jgi:hypothetical protein
MNTEEGKFTVGRLKPKVNFLGFEECGRRKPRKF